MFAYVRVLAMCTLVGYLLPVALMTPETAVAGAVKGLFVGLLIALGQSSERSNGRRESRFTPGDSPFSVYQDDTALVARKIPARAAARYWSE